MTNTINLKNIEKVKLPMDVIEAIDFFIRAGGGKRTLTDTKEIARLAKMPSNTNSKIIQDYITASEENLKNYSLALVVGYVPEKTKEEIEAEKKEAAIERARNEFSKQRSIYLMSGSNTYKEGYALGYRDAFRYLVDKGLADEGVVKSN